MALLWTHVVALPVIGVLRDRSGAFCLATSVAVGAFALAASSHRWSQNVRAVLATLGLLVSCAVLIELFGGLIEAYFHFFIVIAVVSLYQSWRPNLIAVGFVLLHHLVLGTLVPQDVYDHEMAMERPWLFALVHGGAVLGESVACLVFWKLTEDTLLAERASRGALQEANEDLARANNSVADLVAMLSHDLRVPVSVLIGYTELAVESWPRLDDTERLVCVRRANPAGNGLRSLLEEFLAVSALDGDGLRRRPRPVPLLGAVEAALAGLPGTAPDVRLQGPETCEVVVDPNHLGQVLTNLFTNAVEYGGGRFVVSANADGTRVPPCRRLRIRGGPRTSCLDSSTGSPAPRMREGHGAGAVHRPQPARGPTAATSPTSPRRRASRRRGRPHR